ncbi:MAG TPA: hypothetical protein VMD08_04365 [Candidatus Baltobacteraceae bacterium]|nr:hypothetical protein [Candidatus Baltobacteraceae bacterium]
MTNLQLFLALGIPVLFNPPARDFWLRDPRHIAGALVRRRPVGDLASWQERQSFRNLTREYSPLGSVPYLEGVVVSSPYVDVRVVPLALCGMKHQPRPSASRSFLAATVAARIGESAWRGKYAVSWGPYADTIRTDLAAQPCQPELLEAFGIMHPEAFRAAASQFQGGQPRSVDSVWEVLSLEAWTRACLT